MLCVEGNVFSAQVRQEFRLFALENPSICFIYSFKQWANRPEWVKNDKGGVEVCDSMDQITL